MKKSGEALYETEYEENLTVIKNINIGDIFTREQLMKIFKISGQSGIMKTNTLNCLVLVTNEENDVYEDGNVKDGKIIYTGEGLRGDQQLKRNNALIYHSKENNLPMYLFSKDKKRRYIYEGIVELVEEPYQTKEKDIEGSERLVWKFPLKVVETEYEAKEDEEISQIAGKVEEIGERYWTDKETEGELKYVEGQVKIRKYRKAEGKLERKSKPDYIAEEIVKSKQGEINEKRIYESEIKRLEHEGAKEQVKKMKEFFENRKDNEGFDILTFERNEDGMYVEKYIEVKSTKGDEGTPIDITATELEFAKENVDNYYLYRIIKSTSKDGYMKKINGKDLLNEYIFIPTTYKIYSK